MVSSHAVNSRPWSVHEYVGEDRRYRVEIGLGLITWKRQNRGSDGEVSKILTLLLCIG